MFIWVLVVEGVDDEIQCGGRVSDIVKDPNVGYMPELYADAEWCLGLLYIRNTQGRTRGHQCVVACGPVLYAH